MEFHRVDADTHTFGDTAVGHAVADLLGYLPLSRCQQIVVTGDTIRSTELALARRGIFVYAAHDMRFNMPEPYGLALSPAVPLKVAELPATLSAELAKRPRLDVSFATTPYVQPAELVPCATWQSA